MGEKRILNRALNGKPEGKRPLSLCEGGRIILKCILNVMVRCGIYSC
jgi:hypothetical protein